MPTMKALDFEKTGGEDGGSDVAPEPEPKRPKTEQRGEDDDDNDDDVISSDGEVIYDYKFPKIYDFEDEDWSNEDFLKYIDTINASKGYVLPPTAPDVIISSWRPARVSNDDECVLKFSQLALDWYMDQSNNKYELVEVKHASTSPAAGLVYRFVFLARALATDITETFKAQVFEGIHKVEVCLCEPAPELASFCTDAN